MAMLTRAGAGPTPTGTARPALTVALTGVAFFMVTLDALVVATAMPSIHRSLGGGLGTLQWTMTAYNIASGAGIITAAALGDRLGRRRVYTVGLAIFTVGSALCALAPSVGMLIGARVLQGLGAATVVPLSLTILSAAFPPERRGTITGIWGGISGLGVAAGPLVGGAITQDLSWHWIFWVNVPIGIAAVFGARAYLPETRGRGGRLDLPGLLLVSAGVAGLIWGLSSGPEDGWASVSVLAALVVGAAAIGGFLVWETRAREPMIPLRLFRAANFSAAVATGFLLGAAIFGAAFLTSQFFQFALHDSPLVTGLKFLPWTGAPLVLAPVAGAVSDRVGARPLIVSGLLLQAAGYAWMIMLAGTGSGYLSYVPALLIAGIGVSMAIPTIPLAALNALPPASLGKASAVYNTLRLFGMAAGTAIVTAVFDADGSLASPATFTAGYRPAIVAAAAASVLAAGTALALRPRKPAGKPAGKSAGGGAGGVTTGAVTVDAARR